MAPSKRAASRLLTMTSLKILLNVSHKKLCTKKNLKFLKESQTCKFEEEPNDAIIRELYGLDLGSLIQFKGFSSPFSVPT